MRLIWSLCPKLRLSYYPVFILSRALFPLRFDTPNEILQAFHPSHNPAVRCALAADGWSVQRLTEATIFLLQTFNPDDHTLRGIEFPPPPPFSHP